MIKVYNTLSRKKEELKTKKEGEIGWYNCGPTVYDFIHIGNARNAVVFDIIRKYLEFRGLKVKYVQNFTDIDDKMINRAKEKGISVKELADKFIKQYYEDAGKLRVKKATVEPKATELIPDMVEFIGKIMDNGYAYETEDGIYFDVEKYRGYGKLSKQKIDELKEGARVDVNEKKKNPLDFVLWKKEKPGEPSWDSPWGKGRPGWHIECSVMSSKYLGDNLDVHSGGKDLVFPHHENEIAQYEAATGKPYIRYWVHNAFLNINKEKMSKSLGNFFTANEVLQKYDARAVRFFFLSTHYRSPIDFSEENMIIAKNALERIDNFVFVNKDAEPNPDVKVLVDDKRKEFIDAMDDDFDTPKGIAVVFDFIKEVNKVGAGREAYEFLKELDSVFCVLKEEKEEKLDSEIEAMINEREEARGKKEWEKADKIRDELKKKGIELMDTPEGVKWKNVS